MTASSPLRAGGRRRISIVLPVRNEQESLRPLYTKTLEVLGQLPVEAELVFVDDGSTDGSFRVLQELAATDPRVRAIRFRRNFGKSAAYSAGFETATGEVVLTMDSDLQDDPSEIPLFLAKIDEGFDLVIGWKREGKGPANKTLPSRLFNAVVRRVTGIPLHDFNCPFKAYRRRVLDEIRVYGELHRYIPVLAASRGFSMTEIPIRNLPRQHGRSHYGVERYWRGMLDLITVIFVTRFSKRPSHLLAVGGLIAGGLGFAVLAALVAGHVLYELDLAGTSWKIHDRPAMSLGILLMIVGIQFLVTGLLGELFVIGTMYRGDDKGYSILDTAGAPRPADSSESAPERARPQA